MLTKIILTAGLVTLISCGADKNKDDNSAGDKKNSANLTDGKTGPKGDSGAKGKSGAKGDKGDSGAKGDTGPKYERELNGFYEGAEYFLKINETFYEKSYVRGENVLRESGFTTEFNGKMMFQPKVFECVEGEASLEYTDRDIAEHVNLYRDPSCDDD